MIDITSDDSGYMAKEDIDDNTYIVVVPPHSSEETFNVMAYASTPSGEDNDTPDTRYDLRTMGYERIATTTVSGSDTLERAISDCLRKAHRELTEMQEDEDETIQSIKRAFTISKESIEDES